MTLMEKIRLVAAIAEILVILFKVQGNAGQTFQSSCSSYTVHQPSSRQQRTTWNESLHLCSINNSQLVSIEDENERNFLEEKLEPKRYPRFEYFIGLRKISEKWTWISNNSIEVTPYKDPWAGGNWPDGEDTHCAKMYFKTKNDKFSLVYDDIHCNYYRTSFVGYICERHVGCRNEKAEPEEVMSSIQPSTSLFTTEMISVSRGLQPILFTKQKSGEESKQSKATLAPIHTERRPGGYPTSEKLVIAVFVEGALLMVALVIIGMLLFKLRVKHNSDQSERNIAANSNQLEEPRENVALLNPGNAARQLGLSVEAGDVSNGATLQLTAPPCITEGGYAVLNPRTNTSEGDFYAHLLPSKPENRTSADCSETPSYANETAVMHEYMNV